MITSHYVFDDIINSDEQDLLETNVLSSSTKWLTHNNITGEFGGNINENLPGDVIYWNTLDDTSLSIVSKIEKNSIEKIGFDFVKNLRHKINKTSPLNKEYDPTKLIHIDMGEEHIVIIYYINDSNGDTFLFKNKLGNSIENVKTNFNKIDVDNLELIEKVSPKKGRVFIFNGSLYHYGQYPIIGNRYVINYNTVAKNKILKNLI